MAGVGFLRQWREQKRQGFPDVASLMLGAGLAFLFEAFVVGLVVPAAPYGPASYYNYDRVIPDAFIGEQVGISIPYGLSAWLDYRQVLAVTGFPIQFWRMLSAFAVTFFVLRGLDVFDAIRKRQVKTLEADRDRAQQVAYTAQIIARQTAESWADALVGIGRRIAELDDVDNILLYIAENARMLLRSDFIGLAILNGNTSQPELKCFGTASRTELVKSPLTVTNPVLVNILQNRHSYRSLEGEAKAAFESMVFGSDKPAQAAAAVGLDLDTRPIGVLWVARFQAEPYSETDLIWLESLADQVEIAINHGLMTSQLQTLSVVEERGRIAREMHDGLAQVLGYMNLQVQTLEALLQQGKPKLLEAELAQMRQAVQVAHADVRENILSLRTTLANEKGLVAATAEYLEEFGIQAGIETEFFCDISEDLAVSSLAEVQLVCILQEALTNVRKHARAKRVNVLLRKELVDETEQICMTVTDDGVGFTLSESRRSFGLKTMNERAQSVNGVLSVFSTPGQGSVIECRLPCLQAENLKKPSVVFS
jgi:signal transduction histidine kinase